MQFPPVLNLQLKRFHFDMERMDMVRPEILWAIEAIEALEAYAWQRQVKLNSRFEFPRRLDLSKFAPGAGFSA